jgi:excisionase family DNA binding protein
MPAKATLLRERTPQIRGLENPSELRARGGTERLTCSVEEAAAMLGIGRQAAYQSCRNGALSKIALRFGNKIRIPLRSLQRMLGEDEGP